MADRRAWSLALNTIRDYFDAHAEEGPWMSPAVHAANEAITAAGYRPLTVFERRAALSFILGENNGETREEITERIRKMRAAKTAKDASRRDVWADQQA